MERRLCPVIPPFKPIVFIASKKSHKLRRKLFVEDSIKKYFGSRVE